METKTLTQEKLNVSHKTRTNLFHWRGQFTPELIESLLDCYAPANAVVADPFVGSGTVLLESAYKGINAFGCEINPAAHAMSQFYSLCSLSLSERTEIVECFERLLIPLAQPITVLPLFAPERLQPYTLLEDFAYPLLAQACNSWERTLALNLLFRCDARQPQNWESAIWNHWCVLKTTVRDLPYTPHSLSVHLCDARLADTYAPMRPNLILTSPPYINVFNYHQNHRTLLEAMGWNMLQVATSEFGANRKHRGNRFKTVIQYSLDMEQALQTFWRLLDEHGRMVLVVGRESMVCGSPFYNARLIENLIEGIGGFTQEAKHERQFKNKFGTTLTEDILVYCKVCSPSFGEVALSIAVRHLENALPTANSLAHSDIVSAIAESDMVLPSPLFDPQKALHHAPNAA